MMIRELHTTTKHVICLFEKSRGFTFKKHGSSANPLKAFKQALKRASNKEQHDYLERCANTKSRFFLHSILEERPDWCVIVGQDLLDKNIEDFSSDKKYFFRSKVGGKITFYFLELMKEFEASRCTLCQVPFVKRHRCKAKRMPLPTRKVKKVETVSFEEMLENDGNPIKIVDGEPEEAKQFTTYINSGFKSNSQLICVVGYDLETFTHPETKTLMPLSAVILVRWYVFDKGTIPMEKVFSPLELAMFMEAVDMVAAKFPLRSFLTDPVLQSVIWDNDMIERCQNDHSRVYWLFEPPHNSEGSLVAKHLVDFQHAIVAFFREGGVSYNHGASLCRNINTFQYAKNFGGRFLVVSSSFNGGRFDEIFLMRYRVYGEYSFTDTFRYVKGGGGINCCNSDGKAQKDNNAFRWMVSFRLQDIAKFWNGISLKDLAKDLVLGVYKTGMDFDYVNLLCDDVRAMDNEAFFYTCNLQQFFDFCFEKGTLSDACEIMQTYKDFYPGTFEEFDFKHETYEIENGWSEKILDKTFNFIAVLMRYNFFDVVVMLAAMDKYYTSIDKLSKKICNKEIHIFNCLGTPSVSKQLFMLAYDREVDCTRNNATNQKERIFTPQGDWYWFLRECVYGGRSEIGAVGNVKFDSGLSMLDFNGLYGCMATGPFPIGCPEESVEEWVFKSFESALDNCKKFGFRKSKDEAYVASTLHLGILYAHVDAFPPKKPFNWSPVPYRVNGSLVWSNETRFAQPMCSIHMQILAYAGWHVRIRRELRYLHFKKVEPIFRNTMHTLLQERVIAKQNNDKEMDKTVKLMINAFYGKQLEDVFLSKTEIVEINHPGEFKVGDYKTIRDVRFNKEKNVEQAEIKWVSNLYNPLKPEAEPKVGVVTYDQDTELTTNNTSIQIGVVYLAYSHMTFAEGLYFMQVRNPPNTILYVAAETDSIHGEAAVLDTMPANCIGPQPGDWVEEKKAFDWYMKYEEFKDGSLCKNYPSELILGKKLYLIRPPNDDMHKLSDKFATKGFNRQLITYDVLLQVLKNNCSSTGHEFKEKAKLVRSVPGVRSNNAEASLTGVAAVESSRIMKIHVDSRRPRVPLFMRDLSECFVILDIFNDFNPHPIGQSRRILSESGVVIDCGDECGDGGDNELERHAYYSNYAKLKSKYELRYRNTVRQGDEMDYQHLEWDRKDRAVLTFDLGCHTSYRRDWDELASEYNSEEEREAMFDGTY